MLLRQQHNDVSVTGWRLWERGQLDAPAATQRNPDDKSSIILLPQLRVLQQKTGSGPCFKMGFAKTRQTDSTHHAMHAKGLPNAPPGIAGHLNRWRNESPSGFFLC